MKYSPIKRDVSKYRFALPNDIWTQNLKPPAFAALAYLQYRRCSVITLEELAERTRMSVEMAKACVEALINHKLLTVDLVPLLPNIKGGKFFTVPDEVFYLGLGHGAITVYSPIVNGRRMARNVYAKTEAECEEKLAELIREMKAEIAARKNQEKQESAAG